MPYSGPDDPALPKNVKAAHSGLRKQWVAIWNDVFNKSGGKGNDAAASKGAEAKAFKIANGVLKSAQEGGGMHSAHEQLTDAHVENRKVEPGDGSSDTEIASANPRRPRHAQSTNWPAHIPQVNGKKELTLSDLLLGELDLEGTDLDEVLRNFGLAELMSKVDAQVDDDQDDQDENVSGPRKQVPDGSSDSAKNRQKVKPGSKPKAAKGGVGLAEKMLQVAIKDMIEHTPEGSFEHIRSMVQRALNPPYDPNNPFEERHHMRIIGTYPNHVIATSYGPDSNNDAIHKIPYKYSASKGLELDTANAQRHKIVIAPADVESAKKEIEASRIGVALKKVLDAADRKKIPDSKFGYVDPEGKGHFPIHDEAHVRNALARLGQSPYGPKARSKVMAAARRMGIEVAGKKDFGVIEALGLTSPLQIWMAAKSRDGLEQLGVGQTPEHDSDGDDDFADDTEVGIDGEQDGSGREIKGMNPLGHHFAFEREPDGTLRGWLKGLKERGFFGQKHDLADAREVVGGGSAESAIDAAVKAALDPELALAQKEYKTAGLYTSGAPGALVLCKAIGTDADGTMRFFAPYTNCYKDRHDEIMATIGHKWYAEWATKNQTFPEMWLWHTKGTRWGECDSLDFIDGVMMASGTVDPGCEDVALALASMGDELGWSHGFVGLKNQEGVWTQYIDVEITALPQERAANPYTAPLNIFQIANETKEGGNMPFPAAKLDFYKKAGLSDSVIKAVEGQHDTFVKSLKDLGLEWKDEGGALSIPGTDITISEKDAPMLAPILAGMSSQTAAITGLAGLVKQSIDNSTKALDLATKANTNLEEAVTTAMTGRGAPANGFKASESGLTPEQISALRTKDGAKNEFEPGSPEAALKETSNWFFSHNQNFLKTLGLGGVGADQAAAFQQNGGGAAAAVAAATSTLTGGQ